MPKKTAKPVKARRMCGAMEAHMRLVEVDPEFRKRRARIHSQTDIMIARGMAAKKVPVTIPVVVHVVYKTAAENISMAQITSQIDALNRDYSAGNLDKNKAPSVWSGLIVDSQIRFALAAKDPKGKPTNGVTRTKTKSASFSTHDKVKHVATGGADAWPSDKYLNLWVCTLSNNLLGYAQFPGGPAATDGVVILNTAFGTNGTAKAPFNLGRTATHEVGHWLNLNHIWGDTSDCSGTDHVADTPNAQQPNFGTPAFPHISCGNGPNGDMFMNYMDYVDDKVMVMFTHGQVARMQATMAGPRSSIGA
ncbi:MAG TPA: zinc metalloprotease [Steroidobacteraceae bacterium]|nr:zinc metalloprotease [Steroidobacteraceae bacterium]